MYIPIQMIEGAMAGGDGATPWGNALSAVAKGESYWLEMYPDFSRDIDCRMWTDGARTITANGVGLDRLGPWAIEVLCVQTVAEREALGARTWKVMEGACPRWLTTGGQPPRAVGA